MDVGYFFGYSNDTKLHRSSPYMKAHLCVCFCILNARSLHVQPIYTCCSLCRYDYLGVVDRICTCVCVNALV